MDILQLKQFLFMAETLHFGKASSMAGLSPSAFTRSIKRLEDELGYTLFIRSNRHVVLTPAGKLFKNYAKEILDKITDFKILAAHNEDNLSGVISIFCTVTASYSLLLPIITEFRKSYPDIHIKLLTGDAADTLSKVVDNEVDASISMMPDKLPDSVNFYPLTVTPLIFVAPNFDTKFLSLNNTLLDFKKCPLILPEKGVARQRINSYFTKNKIKPEIYAQVAGNEAILAMVSLGCGVGLVPKLVVEKSSLKNLIRVIDFKYPIKPYHVGLCIKKSRELNPLVKVFKQTALSAVQENIEEKNFD